jgi:hypothetical protein
VKVVTNAVFIWRLAAAAKKKPSDAVKHELKKPHGRVEYFNDDRVVHNWTYKPDKAARYDSNLGNADLVG